MIFILIKTNSISAHKNCTNQSFFVAESSVQKTVSPVLSSKSLMRTIRLSCQNVNNMPRRYKTLKDYRNHTHFFPLDNLFFGFDDSELDEEEDEEYIQKKGKTTKRNRSAYLVGFLCSIDSSQFDEERHQKNAFNHFLNPFYLDVIIQLHSPPPEVFYTSV